MGIANSKLPKSKPYVNPGAYIHTDQQDRIHKSGSTIVPSYVPPTRPQQPNVMRANAVHHSDWVGHPNHVRDSPFKRSERPRDKQGKQISPMQNFSKVRSSQSRELLRPQARLILAEEQEMRRVATEIAALLYEGRDARHLVYKLTSNQVQRIRAYLQLAEPWAIARWPSETNLARYRHEREAKKAAQQEQANEQMRLEQDKKVRLAQVQEGRERVATWAKQVENARITTRKSVPRREEQPLPELPANPARHAFNNGSPFYANAYPGERQPVRKTAGNDPYVTVANSPERQVVPKATHAVNFAAMDVSAAEYEAVERRKDGMSEVRLFDWDRRL